MSQSQTDFLELLQNIGDETLFLLLENLGDFGTNSITILQQIAEDIGLNEIKNDTLNAKDIQKDVLMKILDYQKNTEYGKKFDFAEIKSEKDFLEKHPITNYENYRSIIDDIAQTGNYKTLVAEPIILLQETSGTTGKSKLIPRTNEVIKVLIKAFLASSAIVRRNYLSRNSFFKIKPYCGLALFTSSPQKITPGGIPQGLGSSGGKQSKTLQKFLELNFSSPRIVSSISDYQTSYYLHLLFALLKPDLNFITANFAGNVLESIQILEKKWKELIEDIEYGKINEDLNLEPNKRVELERAFNPKPERAKKLKTEFEKGMKGILPRIWNELTHLQCITTGAMQFYLDKLHFYAGSVPIHSGNFGASEAWLGLNLEPYKKTPSYTITPHSAFFEFIPIEEIESDNPTTLNLTSLQVGESYEILVTTIAGLYRYRMGDIIKCVGYYNQSPTVEFLYRRGSLLNICGEKVSEIETSIAINNAIEVIGEDWEIVDYTTTINLNLSPFRYIFYIEFEKLIPLDYDLTSLAKEIDRQLKSINILYSTFRKANSIGNLELKIVKEGAFNLLKKEILQRGTTESQFKMPRLLKSPELVDYLEKILNQK